MANFNHAILKWSIMHFPSHLYSQQGDCNALDISCTNWSEFALPLAYSCCLSLLRPAQLAWYLFLLLTPRHAPLCTFINCQGLCQNYSVIFSATPATSFPQQGWAPSFLYCSWQNRKRNEAWPPRSEMSDLWGTAFLMRPLSFVLWGFLSPGHASEGPGK